MGDQSKFKMALLGLLRSAGFADLDSQIQNSQSETIVFELTDEADADGTAVHGGITFPYDVRVVSAAVVTPVAVTAHATNYANFIVEKGTVASPTTIASFATDTVTTDDMVAGTAKALTVTASAASVTAGTTLRARIDKAASGVATVAATATTVHDSRVSIRVTVERI
jgi:hypothetical protein